MAKQIIDTIAEVEDLGFFEDEYVYDIGVDDSNPYFFANDILVHNSAYFSAWPVVKDSVEKGQQDWNKETVIALYDAISEQVNESFPAFMKRAFHCPTKYGSIIRCGREVAAESGLFITKKRYALMVYDQEGSRKDVNGSPGKIKAMGLDLKRSDTPKVIQDFLLDILDQTLRGADRDQIIESIREFKKDFTNRPAWEKGSPKRVNNLTKYGNLEKQQGRANMPGHVRAALNWNTLKRINNDNYSMAIVDGMKTIVCKLKPNPLNWTSIGFPTDENRLPEWFKELPFDDSSMEDTVIDQKIKNLLGVLDWDLTASTNTANVFEDLFEF